MPKRANRIPGIKQLPGGKWQARLYHQGGEESRNFDRLEEAERWKRNLKSELDRCSEGVERKNREWLATFIDGSGVYTKSFSDVDEANRWVVRAELASEDGRPIDPESSRVYFSTYVENWRNTKIDISGKTKTSYNSQLRLYLIPEFGSRKMTSISTADIRSWVGRLTNRGIGPTTIRLTCKLLHQILQSAVVDEIISRNPAIGVKLPKFISKKRQALTREQLATLANQCGDQRALVMLMGTCGLRVNEALALRVENIDVQAKTIEVKESWTTNELGRILRDDAGNPVPGSTKTGKVRVIPIPQKTLELLIPNLDGKGPKDWVFTGSNGKVLAYSQFRRAIFMPAVESLGWENVTPHTLRHTCASLLISLGAPVTTVSFILGHASVKMTLDIYGHYYEDDTSYWMNKLGDEVTSCVIPGSGS